MSTKAEAIQQIGEDLGLVPTGQALEAQDEARIDSAYLQAYARVKDKGLASWAYSGEIPSAVVPFFCLLVEESLLTPYSVPESRYLRIKTAAGDNGVIALQKIAEMSVPEYVSEETESDF